MSSASQQPETVERDGFGLNEITHAMTTPGFIRNPTRYIRGCASSTRFTAARKGSGISPAMSTLPWETCSCPTTGKRMRRALCGPA